MDIVEIIELLIGCAIGAGACFAFAYYYNAWKREYIRAEAEREEHHDN